MKTGQKLVWLPIEEEPTNKPFLLKKLNLYTKNTFL